MDQMESLRQEIRAQVRSDAEMSFINTRLILRTGVDLNSAECSPERLSRAVSVLRSMGLMPERKP